MTIVCNHYPLMGVVGWYNSATDHCKIIQHYETQFQAQSRNVSVWTLMIRKLSLDVLTLFKFQLHNSHSKTVNQPSIVRMSHGIISCLLN